jgi:hypothetical protein
MRFSLPLRYLATTPLVFGIMATALTSIAQAVPKTSPSPAPETAIAITCDSRSNPPVTRLKKGTNGESIAIMTWYPNYLIPQDSSEALCKTVAQKLQSQYQKNEDTFLAFDQLKNEWRVCFVAQAGDNCSAPNSQPLFSLNAAFVAPKCVMENIAPAQCPLNPTTRGPVISVPGGTYKPFWWIFRP